MARAEGINVVPCLFVCKRDFVRCEAYDLAVLLVKLSLTSSELAGQQAINEGQAGGSPKLGSGELGEWMKIKTVYGLRSWVLHEAKSVRFCETRGARLTDK